MWNIFKTKEKEDPYLEIKEYLKEHILKVFKGYINSDKDINIWDDLDGYSINVSVKLNNGLRCRYEYELIERWCWGYEKEIKRYKQKIHEDFENHYKDFIKLIQIKNERETFNITLYNKFKNPEESNKDYCIWLLNEVEYLKNKKQIKKLEKELLNE